MLGSVLAAPINLFFDITPSGKLISRFTEDVGIYRGEIQNCITTLFDWTFWIGGIFSMLFYQSKTVFVFIPFFYFGTRNLFASAKIAFFQNGLVIRATDGPKHSHFSETNNGLSTIRAFKL
jgi:ABC-type multidrug transport system fused ATPase/permease subunit